MLYSLHGFHYCDLLLAQGLANAVIERATYALEAARVHKIGLHAIPLGNLALGRAYAALALSAAPRYHEMPLFQSAEQSADIDRADMAERHLNAAIDDLRRANHNWALAPGLLARAAFHRGRGDLASAGTDLAEAFDISGHGEMRPHLADCHLEAVRLALARFSATGDATHSAEAETHYADADQLIAITGYNRRLPELAALRACLDGHIPASILAPDCDASGRPIWHDLAIPA